MIQSYKISLFSFLFFLCVSCNTKTTIETTETTKVENVHSKEAYGSGKWLEELPSKTPLTFNELRRFAARINTRKTVSKSNRHLKKWFEFH